MLDNKKSISNRKFSNGNYVIDDGYRRDQPVALVERNWINNKKEYVIAFNYEIKDNKISWGYGYYYDDKEQAKKHFKKVLKGHNLIDIYDKEQKKKNEMER